MPKPKPAFYGDALIGGSTPTRQWDGSHGQYISGRAYLDEADLTASEMEAKWGAGRLRLLVGPELREKFDRQRYKLNQAIWHGQLEDVRREAQRMVTGWLALDKAATAAGKATLPPTVWEVALEDGTVAAIVPTPDHARGVERDGRKLAVFTLDEIARMLSAWQDTAAVKLQWPGATVEAVRRTVPDPLDAIHDTQDPLDDPMPF